MPDDRCQPHLATVQPLSLHRSARPSMACAIHRTSLRLTPSSPVKDQTDSQWPPANSSFPIDRSGLAKTAALSRRKRRCRAPTFCSAKVGGGGERNRTDDLLLAKQALSQLSYTPSSLGAGAGSRFRLRRNAWWAREDLNLRPHAYQARALTN